MNEDREVARSAADDVSFGLETLKRFCIIARGRTRDTLVVVDGDRGRVDVPNLAASLVPPYSDEVRAIAHLMSTTSAVVGESTAVFCPTHVCDRNC